MSADNKEKVVAAVGEWLAKIKQTSLPYPDNCPLCKIGREAGGLYPSHNGSKNCANKDGGRASIAAGGTEAHCTCDNCF